jgi:hypothetical protein
MCMALDEYSQIKIYFKCFKLILKSWNVSAKLRFTGWGGANLWFILDSVSNKEPQNRPHVAVECEFSLFGRLKTFPFISVDNIGKTLLKINWKKVNLFKVKDNSY